MRKTTIRELKHQTTTVLSWVASGETVQVLRRNVPVAVLSPVQPDAKVATPDFSARLKSIYGSRQLETTATDLISDSRGRS